MKLPLLLEKKIADNSGLLADVHRVIERSQDWIGSTPMVFFPNYTRHDPKHNEEVLHAAAELITDEATQILTGADAAVLTLAVILHDCAMHLSEDGFLGLVRGSDEWRIVEDLDERSWPDLWRDYLAEAARFDGRQLKELFGNTEPVTEPSDDPTLYTERDKLLIGDFLRRHHPRLAHEIALNGVPGPDGSRYEIAVGVSGDLADLSGLIARSHGHDMRDMFGYLESKYHIRDYNGVHAVYLMSLLRIADFIQIQPDRAPDASFETRRIRSPFSVTEWKVHQSVRNITKNDPDPEAISVDADPKDVSTFLRLKSWTDGLQRELDRSWAVLGEVYGLYQQQNLDKLGLKLRRIRSNIDDAEGFASQVDYLPRQIHFSAKNPDMLKLLVGPLYDYDPVVGIRELLQNSVDSVREMEHVLESHEQLASLDRCVQDGDVLIQVDYESGLPSKLIVSDRGTGMSPAIVEDYFLKAGASFRSSDVWRNEFEDRFGAAKIFRTGRFGVGALASFLLGNRIEVTTRHYTEESGLSFSASIDDDHISVGRRMRSIGTTISVEISVSNAQKLHTKLFPVRRGRSGYDGDSSTSEIYFLDNPSVRWSVRRQIDDFDLSEDSEFEIIEPGGKKYGDGFLVPSPGSRGKGIWRYLPHPDYASIHWTFSKAPAVVCNGILVADEDYGAGIGSLTDRDWHISAPSISVFDQNGNLPVNLQRSSVSGSDLQFRLNLKRAIQDEFFAYYFVRMSERPECFSSRPSTKYPSAAYRQGWAYLHDGFALADPEILSCVPDVKVVTFVRGIRFDENEDKELFIVPDGHAVRALDDQSSGSALEANLRLALSYRGGFFASRRTGRSMNAENLMPEGAKVYLNSSFEKILRQHKSAPKFLIAALDEFQKCKGLRGWKCLSEGADVGLGDAVFREKMSALQGGGNTSPALICHWILPDGGLKAERSETSKIWKSLFGDSIIPYSHVGRSKNFDKYKKKYGKYLNGIEKIDNELPDYFVQYHIY